MKKILVLFIYILVFGSGSVFAESSEIIELFSYTMIEKCEVGNDP